jgi:hypothetical protein
MNQGRPKLKCVTEDKDKTLKVGTCYAILDYYYCGNELLIENEQGYFKWYSVTLFGYQNIDELLEEYRR